jgi:hypothetical protein
MARVNATLEGSLKAAAAPATTREEHGPSIVQVRKSAGTNHLLSFNFKIF